MLMNPWVLALGHSVLPWYGQTASQPAREFWGRTMQSSTSQFEGGVTTAFAGIAHLPHVVFGMSPYLSAVALSSKASKAKHILELYNLSAFARVQYYLNLDKLASKWFLGSSLPSKAQAVKAARTIKFASRAVPVIGAAALAYDVYDIVVNRSFWGIDFS